MRIDRGKGLNGIQNGPARQRGGSANGGFSVEDAGAARQAPSAGGAAGIAGVDALITLQAVEGQMGRGPRLDHGRRMLDLLDDIRIEMLGGQMPAIKLERLADELGQRPRRDRTEPVEGVLDEIELRARVELAKLGREAA